MLSAETIRKVQVLRTFLATLKEYTTPTLNVDNPVRGGVHGAGSRLGTLSRWLMPDVMLCLDRSESVPMFVLIQANNETFAATLEGIDAWLKAHEQDTVQHDIDESVRVLQREVSRLSDAGNKSASHKALNVLRRHLQPGTSA